MKEQILAKRKKKKCDGEWDELTRGDQSKPPKPPKYKIL